MPATPPRPEPAALVGRDRELAVLRDALAAALAGRGSLMLLGGEAGIGKTTLAEAICRDASEQGALVLVGRCYDLTDTPPYGPWIDLFAHLPAEHALPPLPAAFATPGTVGAVSSQAALFQQILDFVRLVVTQCPLVLLLDDQHWADVASLNLLRFLARELALLPVLLLATYRADELTRRHPLYTLLPVLVREARATRLDLRPLGDDGLRALVAAHHALSPGDTDRLSAYLRDRAEGNPFFAGELLRTLEEGAVLRPEGSSWVLGDLAAVGVPPLLRQVLDARLDRLGEVARGLLAVAAMVGHEVPLALWAAVAETDDDGLLATIELAVEARLLTETPEGTAVRFAHALIRETLYAAVLGMRRRALHRRTGEALAAMPAPDPDAVAYHLQQAGDDRAADWLVRAGERAQRAYAWLTAAARYEAALALLVHAPAPPVERGWLLYRLAVLRRGPHPRQSLAYLDEAARIAADAAGTALAAGALFLQGFLRANHESSEQAVAILAVCVEALEALTPGDQARLNVEDGLPAAATSRLWRGALVFHLALVGRYAEALAMGERFLAATVAPAATLTLRGVHFGGALLGVGIAHAMLGRPAEAQRALTEARTWYQSAGMVDNAIQTVMYQLSFAQLPYAADRVQARAALASAVERSTEGAQAQLLHPPGSAQIWLWLVEARWGPMRAWADGALRMEHAAYRHQAQVLLAPLLRAQGEPAAAWGHIQAYLPLGPDAPPGSGRCDQTLGLQRVAAHLALDAGDLPMARAWLAAHHDWRTWSGAVLGQSEEQALWARYHRLAGDPAVARSAAKLALALADAPRQPLALLAAHRTLGELETADGRHADAGAHLAEALRLAEACAAPYERALTLLALTELYIATADHDLAWSALTEARTILEPLGAKPALARAAVLADTLDSPSATPAPQPFPAGLSAREAEVLRLVAQGLPNADIAARLFLSPRTVTTHLTAIYTKLGVENRAAATAFAIDHGLR